mmetsp:Transcript_24739/g.59637  ORF Transcript_24739/g.59637 Transcript_24739/m.59637 type:complete len:400 (-) Transcript_24739:172-1371(-)|eukprot:CAMPEP_0181114884 /NCGR_PEP_ID=MMETSP1071-20121207/21139_1 /TAXON_ID=35127 /ORGANISM="Thalassiosira sp., Strain NH16" /LENGTH=399 /DNA_ID=CAMNT_0023199059 /DNA_START=130 /DNA_END=1329 /DNA_ORIENTATION=+
MTSFILLFVLLQLVICVSSSKPNNTQFRTNPYEILRVDSSCSQKEIQRQYRKLCLTHHPDKKRNTSTVGDEPGDAEAGGGLDEDFEFKEVQHAYSLIGTEESRRNFELRRKLFTPSSSADSQSGYFGHPTNNNGFRDQSNMFGPSTIYFTFGNGSFKFARSRSDLYRANRGRAYNNPFFGTNLRHPYKVDQQSKPHFIQKVSVPLHVLYAGADDVELKLKTSVFERYRAAFNGGALAPILMQSILTVFLTWLRSQKINWFLSVFLFASIVHMNTIHMPLPPEKAVYSTKIRKGWKSGTKIKYASTEADITFVLQESTDDTFTRVGNDLHTQVEVSAKQLRRGCTLTIKPLCASEEPIKLKLRPREVKNGQFVTIKSRGWPKGGDIEDFGDLRVKINCRA